MAIDAIKTNSNTLVQRVKAKEQGKPDALQKDAESTSKPENLIFAQKTKFAQETPKLSAFVKPVAEHSQAAAGTTKPAPQLFTFNNEGRFVVASHNPSGTVSSLASALTGAENNKGSGDKKDEKGNIFLSAHKSLKDTRFEALEDDNCMSIMKGLC